jgi:MATE family multidrug resistance protein
LADSSTRDEVGRIAALAAPIALAQFGITALGLVDVAVLGHASPVELGGAAIGRSIAFVAVALGLGATNALEPLAAQAVGAREPHGAWRAFVATLAACAIVWVPCAVLAYASTWALVPLGIDADLVPVARAFLVPQLPGMLLYSFFLAAKVYLQAHKRTGASLLAAVVANIVNLAVCNVLVRGDEPLVALGLPALGLPRLGALGAGLASTIASLVLAGWVFVAAFRLRPDPADAPNEPLPIAKVLRLGMPVGLQVLAEIGVFSFVSVVAGRLGKVPVSAHQIAIGLASFTFMGALGIGGATAVRVGHAVGEGRSTRASGLVGIALGAAFMGACALMFLVVRRPLVAIFTEDPPTAELAASLLGVAAAFQLFDGVQAVAAGALRGAGDVRFPFAINVAAHWLVGLPLSLYLAFVAGWGARGLWWGLMAGLALVAIALLFRFASLSKGPIARV